MILRNKKKQSEQYKKHPKKTWGQLFTCFLRGMYKERYFYTVSLYMGVNRHSSITDSTALSWFVWHKISSICFTRSPRAVYQGTPFTLIWQLAGGKRGTGSRDADFTCYAMMSSPQGENNNPNCFVPTVNKQTHIKVFAHLANTLANKLAKRYVRVYLLMSLALLKSPNFPPSQFQKSCWTLTSSMDCNCKSFTSLNVYY